MKLERNLESKRGVTRARIGGCSPALAWLERNCAAHLLQHQTPHCNIWTWRMMMKLWSGQAYKLRASSIIYFVWFHIFMFCRFVYLSYRNTLFICLVRLDTWSFPTLLIGRWWKSDGGWRNRYLLKTQREGRLQERTVNLDKRCGINVTFVTNTNCAAETNTSVHSSEIPLFLNGTPKLFTSCLYLLNRSQNRYKISNKMPQTRKINQ